MHGADFVVGAGGEHDLRLVLGVETDTPDITNSGTPILVAIGRYEAEPAWITLLDGITREQWPPGYVRGQPDNYLYDHYPPGLQQVCDSSIGDLSLAARRFLGIARWRFADRRTCYYGNAFDLHRFLSTDAFVGVKIHSSYSQRAISSPQMRDLFALLNDFRLSNGKSPLGFINPLLYSLQASAFNDIVSGSNPGCETNGKLIDLCFAVVDFTHICTSLQ